MTAVPLDALIAAVAADDDVMVQTLVRGLTAAQLRTAVVELAARVPRRTLDTDDLQPLLVHAAALCQTTATAVLAGGRRAEELRARQITAYAAHSLGHSYSRIGRFLDRDHSTVLHACRAVQGQPRLRRVAQEIADQLVREAA